MRGLDDAAYVGQHKEEMVQDVQEEQAFGGFNNVHKVRGTCMWVVVVKNTMAIDCMSCNTILPGMASGI